MNYESRIILWVTAPCNPSIYEDPLVGMLAGQVRIKEIEVSQGDGIDDMLRKIKVELAPKGKERMAPSVAILIDAFLRPKEEGIEGEEWIVSTEEVQQLLRVKETKALLSLQLMWALRSRLSTKIPVLISTNGIALDPEKDYMLSSAFMSGRLSMVYGWDSHPELLADTKDSV